MPSARLRPHRWAPFVASVVAIGASTGCLIELDRDIACGDGYVDSEVGEECDPLDDTVDLEKPCVEAGFSMGVARCDPDRCTIIADREQCARCGDGRIDLEEQCDAGQLGGARCPNGDDDVICDMNTCTLDYRLCSPCGNGELEDQFGEECEPGVGGGGFGAGKNCEDFATEQFPYTSGTATFCDRDTCTLARDNCGYCGNGFRNDASLIAPNMFSDPELCDGNEFDEDRLQSLEPLPVCDGDPDLRRNVACNSNCQSYEVRTGVDACCIKPGRDCPLAGPGDDFQCCYTFEHPEEGGDGCETIQDLEGQRRVCR